MVLHHIYVGVQPKHVCKAGFEALLVQLVGILAYGVDEGAVHVCIQAADIETASSRQHNTKQLLEGGCIPQPQMIQTIHRPA